MEAQEIFGDVDELLSRRKQDLERDDTSRFAPKQIEDEFEPFILSEKYMTPKDDIIRESDVPERLQVGLISLSLYIYIYRERVWLRCYA
jgi:transcription elongation factor SPT6